MPNTSGIVMDSVRTKGRDTLVERKTYFLNLDANREPTSPSSEPSFKLWTEQHEAESRARREFRESVKEKKPNHVATVSDFDPEEHLKEQGELRQREIEKQNKPKWKFW